jgi:hypothetical protein
MKRLLFYAAGRPFDSLREAAEEVTRISGENAELWKLRKILDGNKGFMNGVPVFQRAAKAETVPNESRDEESAPQELRERRRPLMRTPVWGIPPRWR